MQLDLLTALRPVVAEFQRLGILFHVGGSVASSAHGAGRSTQDVDLVAELHREHVKPLAAGLAGAFYVSEPMILSAIERQSCFNLIHLPTMFKVDVFVLKRRPFDQIAFRRARLGPIGLGDDHLEVPLASAEDVVLNKLEWFRQGGEVSERQWRDVQGVLKVRGPDLDRRYLEQWAAELGVLDLLQRALTEAGFGQ
jgi:hypothetical protein